MSRAFSNTACMEEKVSIQAVLFDVNRLRHGEMPCLKPKQEEKSEKIIQYYDSVIAVVQAKRIYVQCLLRYML